MAVRRALDFIQVGGGADSAAEKKKKKCFYS